MNPSPTAIAAALACALLVAAPARADPAALDGRIENLERLLERSSGARRVRDSGDGAALAAHAEAGALLARARERAASGDAEAAARLLDQASAEMFRAVRLAGDPPGAEQKQLRDYDDRASSVAALMEALDRIAAEKGAHAAAAEAKGTVTRLLDEAQTMKTAGDHEGGRRTLDAAYDIAKRSIEQLRGGDTLVRSLDFASKEEEYRYEIDRNDTHEMLITVLLEDKRGDPARDRLIDGFVATAHTLRARAEDEAGRGDFTAAVQTLEASTRELVRAIRSAGVYIPG